MANIQGAMLKGRLLPKEEFISTMVELLKEYKIKIQNNLMAAEIAIETGQIRKAYMIWESLQTDIFQNPSVDLMAIVNWWKPEIKMVKEAKTISENGQIKLSQVKSGIEKLEAAEIFTKHLSNLMRTLYSEKPDDKELKMIRSALKQQRRKNKHRGTYVEELYPDQKSWSSRGQFADAFLQHVGEYHADLLNTNRRHFGYNITTELQPVKIEEGSNFIPRLLQARNQNRWYTGGDLILTASDGTVIANIQLKTTADAVESEYWKINVQGLKKDIKKIQDIMDSDNTVIANEFYNMLETSGISSTIEQGIEDLAYSLIPKLDK